MVFERNVAEENVNFVGGDQVVAVEVEPAERRPRVRTFNRNKADTYIWKVSRIFVSTLLENTCSIRSTKDSSKTRPSCWLFEAREWNLSETMPGRLMYSTKVTLSIDLTELLLDYVERMAKSAKTLEK